jgi:small subunit ribosomal protein S19
MNNKNKKKLPYVDFKLLKRIMNSAPTNDTSGKVPSAQLKTPTKVHKTYSRASKIIPQMFGALLAVHNGHKFIPILISEKMIGRTLGEFVPTRSTRKKK